MKNKKLPATKRITITDSGNVPADFPGVGDKFEIVTLTAQEMIKLVDASDLIFEAATVQVVKSRIFGATAPGPSIWQLFYWESYRTEDGRLTEGVVFEMIYRP